MVMAMVKMLTNRENCHVVNDDNDDVVDDDDDEDDYDGGYLGWW